jgi:hypothetical protein
VSVGNEDVDFCPWLSLVFLFFIFLQIGLFMLLKLTLNSHSLWLSLPSSWNYRVLAQCLTASFWCREPLSVFYWSCKYNPIQTLKSDNYGLGCTSVLKYLFSMCEALGSIHSIIKIVWDLGYISRLLIPTRCVALIHTYQFAYMFILCVRKMENFLHFTYLKIFYVSLVYAWFACVCVGWGGFSHVQATFLSRNWKKNMK